MAYGYVKRMRVDNEGFLLDLMGKDCTDIQQYRELLQNALEALLRHGLTPGTIQFDYDRELYAEEGILKLCIIDTGIGMNAYELEQFINGLCVSGGIQALNRNFGVGAKIAAGTRNHYGLGVFSWRHGREKGEKGCFLHFARDEQTGTYGLMPLNSDPENPVFVGSISDDLMPEAIRKAGHGTKVVLMGNSREENTMNPPIKMPGGEAWLLQHLNSRYFHIPENIKISVRTRYSTIKNEPKTGVTPTVGIVRVVSGQKSFLDENSISSGVVDLSDARAHWWILKEGLLENKKKRIYHNAKGHSAILYQNEVYDNPSDHRTHRGRLLNFGATFGFDRVVILIEPLRADAYPDTARTVIKINGEDAPWHRWQDEFFENRPKELIDYVNESRSKGSAKLKVKDWIREKLKNLGFTFSDNKYKKNKTGPDKASGETQMKGGGRGKGSLTDDPTQKPPRKKPGRRSDLGGFLDQDGEAAKKVSLDSCPDIQLVSIHDGTRGVDEMVGRAASYDRRANLIKINMDYDMYHRMVEMCIRETGHGESVVEIASTSVYKKVAWPLVLAVLGAYSHHGDEEWSPDDVESVCSEESLTGVVLSSISYITTDVKREIGSKAGKSRKPEKATV
jgi:hypothetical protein